MFDRVNLVGTNSRDGVSSKVALFEISCIFKVYPVPEISFVYGIFQTKDLFVTLLLSTIFSTKPLLSIKSILMLEIFPL